MAVYIQSFGLHVQTLGMLTDTIIDHIYSYNPESIYLSSVSDISISDHFPVSLVRKHHGSIAKQKSHKTIKYRGFKKFDSQMFHKDLVDAPWSILDSSEESDDTLYLWKTLFVSIIDKLKPCEMYAKTIMADRGYMSENGRKG